MKNLFLPIDLSLVHFPAKKDTWARRMAMVFLLGFVYLSASASTFTVTTAADDNSAGSLRKMIAAAIAAGVGPHTVNVPAGLGTYNISMGTITMYNIAGQNITIQGTGGIATINMSGTGANKDRIFLVNYNVVNNDTTYFKNLTMTNGYAGADMDAGGAVVCGGIGNLTDFNNCTFTNNTVRTDESFAVQSYGGAINNFIGGTLNIANCTFTNNSDPGVINASPGINRPGNGGAVRYVNNGTYNGVNLNGKVTITDSKFDNNTTGVSNATNGGSGAAISIFDQTNATLSGQTIVVNIVRNTFTNNKALGNTNNSTNVGGGAIFISNPYSTNTINYNRFYNNTATYGSALYVNNAPGTVDATNNWWGCNDGPSSCADKAYALAGGGALTTAPYLLLTSTTSQTALCSGATANITSGFTVNSAATNNTVDPTNLTAFTGLTLGFAATLGTVAPTTNTIASGVTTTVFTAGTTGGAGAVNATIDNVPASDAKARASIAVNAPASISGQPSDVTDLACTGNPVSFSVTPGGGPTLTYQWYKGTTALVNGATGTGSTIANATTTTLTISNPSTADNASNYNVKVTSSAGCGPAVISNNATLTISAPVTATATTTASKTISSTNTIISNTSCNLIATVTPSGAVPVSGMVTATVTIAGSVPVYNGKAYVQRHYDIVPATNASTATANLTLYFTQSDFTNYNAYTGTTAKLPTGPSDAAGIANIRISQYHGTGTAPGNYTGTSIDIDPADNNIVWNATYSRWEITFAVTGFSGFYLSNPNTILPLTLLSFAGHPQTGSAALQWTTSNEVNTAYFELQRSTDGINFAPIAKIATTGNGSTGVNTYQYTDALGTAAVYYYQLKMVDKDGKSTISDIVSISAGSGSNYLVQATPNPFQGQLLVNILATEQAKTTLTLTDMSGKILLLENTILNQGANNIHLDGLSGLAAGTYLLRISNNKVNQTVKLVKTN